jgi:hypothetical protein
MRLVNLASATRPEWFGSQDWRKRTKVLSDFIASAPSKRIQARASSVIGNLPEPVTKAVWDLFEGRCSMCEVNMVSKTLDGGVARFRPIEVEDAEDRFVYSYAALLWENLILLCADCNRARGDRFPLLDPRLSEGARHSTIRSRNAYDSQLERLRMMQRHEKPVVIDPTTEQPAVYLSCSEDGLMSPNPFTEDQVFERAKASIGIFNLNRADLVRARRIKVAAMLAHMRGRQDMEYLLDALPLLGGILTDDYQLATAYAFVQNVLPWCSGSDEIFSTLEEISKSKNYVQDVLREVWREVTIADADSPKDNDSDPASERQAAAHALDRKVEPELTGEDSSWFPPYFFPSARIKRVHLKNFRQFKDTTFDFPTERPTDALGRHSKLRALVRRAKASNKGKDADQIPPEPFSYCGWKMLLGENGVGKSSILQAIAIALSAHLSGKLPRDFDASANLAHDASSGFIRIWMDDSDEPISLLFSRRGVKIEKRNSAATVFLRGYGATRLPPRDTTETPGAYVAQNEIENLFNPYSTLRTDPVWWLQSLDTDPQRLAFITLKDLLDLPDSIKLELGDWHGKRTIGLNKHGRFEPLQHLSAGYQSIIALGCDLMAGFGDKGVDMQKKTGIVLLDEIGTNLHPSWRLRIVDALRRAFPMIQFVASTHEPLCLRGLGEREVSLLTFTENHEVDLRDDLPSPALYRVDQLLTGDFFGLSTAYDPDEEEAFQIFHTLSAHKAADTSLSEEQIELLAMLEEILKDRLMLGNTAAERHLMTALEIAEREMVGVEPGRREPLKGSDEALAAAKNLLRVLPGKDHPVASS